MLCKPFDFPALPRSLSHLVWGNLQATTLPEPHSSPPATAVYWLVVCSSEGDDRHVDKHSQIPCRERLSLIAAIHPQEPFILIILLIYYIFNTLASIHLHRLTSPHPTTALSAVSLKMGLHADGTKDPDEVRNWRIHLIAIIASMSAIASNVNPVILYSLICIR